MPENAGGSATDMTSMEILSRSPPMPHSNATPKNTAGVRIRRKNVFQMISRPSENRTVDNASPAESTATPEFALAIRSNVGATCSGTWMPSSTSAMASSGAQHTGCFSASSNACILPCRSASSPLAPRTISSASLSCLASSVGSSATSPFAAFSIPLPTAPETAVSFANPSIAAEVDRASAPDRATCADSRARSLA